MRPVARVLGLAVLASFLALPGPLRAQVCGDGVVDPGETCDPPNPSLDPVTHQIVCRSDCTSCGDGVVQAEDSETCDLGHYPSCGFCLNSCVERIFYRPACFCALDDPALADIRADVLTACQCESAPSKHAFLRCARERLALIPEDRFAANCRRGALKCLAHSVCGKPGAVTCCRTNATGHERCVIESDAAGCTAPPGGSASLGVSQACCDACP